MSESTDPHLDLDDADWVAPEIDEKRTPPLHDPVEGDLEADLSPAQLRDRAAREAAITAMSGILAASGKLPEWRAQYSFWGPDCAAVIYASPNEATFVHIGTQRLGPEPYDWPIEFRIDTDMLGRQSHTEDILAAVDAQAELRSGIVQALQAYATSQAATGAAAGAQQGLLDPARELEH